MATTLLQKRCPINGCTNSHPSDKLMCARHWARVPPDVQKRVYQTYRQKKAKKPDAIRNHLAACREAIQAARQPTSN